MSPIKTTTVTPYLMLSGKAREVMNFYHKAIGGELKIQTFGEMQGPPCPDALRDLVMHSTLKYGDFLLMASDGNLETPAQSGNTVQLAIGAPDAELVRLFKALSEEAQQIDHELFDAPWGGKF